MRRWAAEIDVHLSAIGALDATQYRYPIETPWAHKAWSDQQLLAYEEMSEAIVTKVGGDAQAFRNLVKKVSKQYPQGADIYYCPVVCVARKP